MDGFSKKYKNLLQQLDDQEEIIRKFPELKGANHETLIEKYKYLIDYLDSKRSDYAIRIEFHFDSDAPESVISPELVEKASDIRKYLLSGDWTPDKYADYAVNPVMVEAHFNSGCSECVITTEAGEFTTQDSETIGYLLDVYNGKKSLSAFNMKQFGYDDDWLLDELPWTAGSHMKSLGVAGFATSLALFAYDRNQRALDLISYVRRANLNEESGELGDIRCQSFKEAAKEDQVKNYTSALSEALIADSYLRRAVVNDLAKELIHERFTTSDKIKQEAIKIEQSKAKNGARSKHADNYRKQEKIIEIYLSGSYQIEYRTPHKKTATARKILRQVNEWCAIEGIPKYLETDSGGIKTVKRVIEQYEKQTALLD